ncbi:hypothetical protein BDR04DRAFT_1103385 [Suillus decipiens]|nr:hypothetical protein BDR04DRAFT_1103385 [Suillus decipiens]
MADHRNQRLRQYSSLAHTREVQEVKDELTKTVSTRCVKPLPACNEHCWLIAMENCNCKLGCYR